MALECTWADPARRGTFAGAGGRRPSARRTAKRVSRLACSMHVHEAPSERDADKAAAPSRALRRSNGNSER
jgi:hypothetical protein